MALDKWIVLGVMVALFLMIWIVQVWQKNDIIRTQEKAIEAFADLNPELRKEFGGYQYIDSEERDGYIELPRVLKYLEAKESTKASQDATSLVERVESRFNK